MTRVLAVEIDDFNSCELRNLTSRKNQLPNNLLKSTVKNLILIQINPYWQIMENSSGNFSEIFIFSPQLIHSNCLTETIRAL